MKHILSVLLCVALLLALAPCALAAEEGADPSDKEAQLTEIASAVKEMLEVDDDYAQFQGDYYDGLRPCWYLNWMDSDRGLSVTCDTAGVVTEIYRWHSDAGDRFSGFDAAFPLVTEEEARAQAERWLDRLMSEGETAQIRTHGMTLLPSGEHSFRGVVLANGRETPVEFTIYIGQDGLSSYYRSDSYKGYTGEIPSPEPETEEAEAAARLAEATVLDLYYVSDESGEARLRYVPVNPETVVDAQSGEAVDMEALYAAVGGEYTGMERSYAMEESAAEAADTAGGRALTEVELASIARYAQVRTEEDLDAALREVPALGLEDFRMTRCSYAMDGEGEAVTATLTYRAEMNEDRLFGFSLESYYDYTAWGDAAMVYKTITVDAVTGALTDLYTSYPLWGTRSSEGEELGDEIAEAFLSACAEERFAETMQNTGVLAYGQSELTYTRLHEGYYFPENYLRVTLNMATGTVDEFHSAWDEDVTFADAEGILNVDAAAEAYTGARTVTLGYVAWPEAVDYSDPRFETYISMGYTWIESLRLAYYYSGEDGIVGLDALTGEPVKESADAVFAYEDLEDGPAADRIRALGDVGIGYAGGSFRPDAVLTQGEAVTLLLQAEGYRAEGWSDSDLRREAIWQGFLTGEEWAPETELTQMDLVRMLLGASRYGDAAKLEGIWAGGFPGVAAEDMGFASVAAALGMTEKEAFDPDAPCTRAAGADLLYGFMTRPAA